MKRSQLLGECSAEFFGTMILILFGVGVVAQVVTGGFPTTTGATGDYNSIAWGWGLGVAMAVFVAGRVSGAHLNPAVTVALAVFKGFSWRKTAPYIAAQTAGAFVGALLVRWAYSDAINRVDPGHTKATQGIFSTSPGAGGSIPTAFLDQVIGTAILVMVIFALTSAVNNPPLANTAPLFIGLLVVGSVSGGEPTPATPSTPPATSRRRSASLLTGYHEAMFGQRPGTLLLAAPDRAADRRGHRRRIVRLRDRTLPA